VSQTVRQVRQARRPPAAPPSRRRLSDRRDVWVLVPLRAFLGITFVYAGLQKLADRWFFSASAPSSIQSQLRHAAQHSPIGGILATLSHHAVLVGLAIAFGELIVGILVLLGLWTRAASIVGVLLSLGFLLSVSWHTRPFYYGADIVFVFAWTPLIIGGAGPLSVDEIARADARDRLGLPSDPAVVIGFDTVRQLCGSYDAGRCRARRDRRCMPEGCPVLGRQDPPSAVGDEIDRRTFVQKAGLAGWIGAAAVVGGGVVALIGRVAPVRAAPKATPALGKSASEAASGSAASAAPATSAPGASTPASAPATTGPAPAAEPTTGAPAGATAGPSGAPAAGPTSAAPAPTTAAPATVPAPAPPGMTALGPTSAVAVGGAASFTDPATGDPAFVVQPAAGRFVAFDATCTHQGCPVQFSGSTFQCPCHGAEFDATTGAVLRGPAGSPLRKIDIAAKGGTLYAT